MDPIWYSIRIVATVVMTGIGVLLLWAAYLVSDNAGDAAIAWMVLLGLAIPIGFFTLFTLVGWQRSTATREAPNAVIAWCNDRRRYPFLWLAFLLVLFGGARQIVVEMRQGDADRDATQAYHRAVRDTLFDACWVRAGQAFRQDGGAAASLRPRMMNYCTCLDIEVEKGYTPAQFAAVANDRWWQSGDEKIDRIVQKCRLDDSSFVRAAQTIRKNGGNPESEAMQPKILAYAACVKAELDAGYSAATLMKVSIDPAWQDADAKFRQIIIRCTRHAEF
ncbi:MAG TPA: hypothetical protein VEK82_15070 [Stellaceae bacterium]|nr:hypothetical protein [Stellaceae bacterium]